MMINGGGYELRVSNALHPGTLLQKERQASTLYVEFGTTV